MQASKDRPSLDEQASAPYTIGMMNDFTNNDNGDANPTKENLRTAGSVLAKKGARAGGIARAKKLSPERRREIAQIAAEARWSKFRLNMLK